ncbi:gap junction gamma-3 protein isoform X1 [Mustela erminea]|uniref:gap junction gamma-3 protein isoform X1 n=1 Tax=Mustela erminea TaxID=36723 RepID=UPI001386E3AD|nr:gap junction gamma-3 protein isoform X1 [Mustela erminea]XP_032184198.1 gap junction gamma-3 protein isoform X1 [Mustela erminea]
MCGRFLRQLLAEESRHATAVGRLLLPVLLGSRLVLLAASGPGIYGDEQSEFLCHTQQAGCKVVCYDASRPFSPLRFWAFQVILVAVPSALYVGFTLYHLIWHWEESGKVEEEMLIHQGEKSRDASRAGSPRLLWAYVAQLGVRLVLEGAALGVQYHLYGLKVPSSFVCRQEPCLGSTTCYLSRPFEKTIFLRTMFGVSGLCLFFTLLELVLLGLGRCWRTWKHQSPPSNYCPTAESTKKHKEPTDSFQPVEAKEPFREAGEKALMSPLLPASEVSVLMISHRRSLYLWEAPLPRVTKQKTRF